jgi:phosphatidylserine decarboxylase
MQLHKEGYGPLTGFAIGLIGVNALIALYAGAFTLIPALLSVAFFAGVVNFFRYEPRKHSGGSREVVCPADGRVVVIEEVDETQILGTRCLQVSVFMNVFDMHVNWIPCNGVVEHVSHTPGRFLSAHLPKSSTDNERSAVVIRNEAGDTVLVRQVAGAIARRIVTYPEVGQRVKINENLGFIKFGSRVDLYLPLGSEVHVKVGQRVKGNITDIATLPR